MNVVVSAIVNPWVTTLSFVVALAMRIQGKIYRFFDEIRHVKDRSFGPEFLSLKAASCLSEFTQTWREKPANSSDMVYFSGKSSRHGEKIRRAAGSLRARTAHLARNPVH